MSTWSVVRLIPAHAGKTRRPKDARGHGRAHPRSRGENRTGGAGSFAAAGSSPLTRGKPHVVVEVAGFGGLIPAHAGKTRFLPGGHGAPGAHPRSRGENKPYQVTHEIEGGSSPLTRGKHHWRFPSMVRMGLIPAHAGKTGRWRLRRGWMGAHPRSRGENLIVAVASKVWPGSSPLTRGKRAVVALADHLVGLIPAHAGKTCARWRTRTRQRAHPRSRGENTWAGCPRMVWAGSSPLTRGKLIRRDTSEGQRGLIPAHAGKTARAPISPT